MRSNLRLLDQSVSQQVTAAMANPGKLLTRTQLTRRADASPDSWCSVRHGMHKHSDRLG